jgi:hypothetical protein
VEVISAPPGAIEVNARLISRGGWLIFAAVLAAQSRGSLRDPRHPIDVAAGAQVRSSFLSIAIRAKNRADFGPKVRGILRISWEIPIPSE